jgi:hypothetical protein
MSKLTQEETEMEADEALDIEYQAYLKSVSVQKYVEIMTLSVNERVEVMGDDYEIGDEYDELEQSKKNKKKEEKV